jgi:hypothetical protein
MSLPKISSALLVPHHLLVPCGLEADMGSGPLAGTWQPVAQRKEETNDKRTAVGRPEGSARLVH